jgi:hypothetical protein
VKKLIFVLLSLSFVVFIIPAQEGVPGGEQDTVYVIRSLDFDIDGRTRSSAIMYHGEFEEGKRLAGKAALEKYIASKTQLLINQRVLEAVSIDYTLGDSGDSGETPVDLLIHVKDTWNFIILPYPEYDSNEGLSLFIKARDYNFLGTMSALRVDFGYKYDNTKKKSGKNRHAFDFEIDSDTPFRALDLNWNINFDHVFEYTLGDSPSSLYYKNITGVSVELPFSFTTMKLGIDQYLIFNEENSDQDRAEYLLDERFDGPYAASELYAEYKIPLGLSVGAFGELAYTPRVSGKIAYTKGGVDQPRKPVTALSQTLGFGQVNWTGNYRQGLEASIGNTNNFYFDRPDHVWDINLDIGSKFYWRFGKLFGISTRLQYQQWFNTVHWDAADMLRGIPNDYLRAEQMLSFNLDLPFRILRFAPSEWLNKPKMRVFDFEMHFSPFTDIAIFKGQYDKDFNEVYQDFDFRAGNAIFAAGAELIVFPAFFRSLYLRASVGYNINRIIKTRDIPKYNEIFIGMGHHY